MKRYVSIFLIFALCLFLPACNQETVRIQEPVNFYFRRAEVTYGAEDGVICAQSAESAGYEDDLAGLLKSYLKTVPAEGLISPFPKGTILLSLTIEGDNADILLTDAFSRNQGMDLTIACACLTMTVLELTDVKTVSIRTSSSALQIVMDRSCLLLIDDSAEEAVEE